MRGLSSLSRGLLANPYLYEYFYAGLFNLYSETDHGGGPRLAIAPSLAALGQEFNIYVLTTALLLDFLNASTKETVIFDIAEPGTSDSAAIVTRMNITSFFFTPPRKRGFYSFKNGLLPKMKPSFLPLGYSELLAEEFLR
jgi:hypothetical protein